MSEKTSVRWGPYENHHEEKRWRPRWKLQWFGDVQQEDGSIITGWHDEGRVSCSLLMPIGEVQDFPQDYELVE